MLKIARYTAKKKGREFNLGPEDIVIPDVCPVLGIPLITSLGGRSDSSPSLDRIDSSRGYVKGNVIVVSWRANYVKNNGTPEEHEKIWRFYAGLSV